MIIDLSSPVEMRGYELLHDDAGTTRAYIDLFNLSERTVTGYAGTLRWSNDLSGKGANDSFAVDEIAIPGGGMFKLMLSGSLVPNADRVEIYFSKVTFEDGGVWTPRDGDLVDVGEQDELTGSELTHLKDAAGDDAVMYPETQDKFWRCVCGRINPLEQDECARCRRERAYVLGELNRKILWLDKNLAKARVKRRRKAAQASSKPVDSGASIFMYRVFLTASAVIFLIAVLCLCLAK